jgi:hypothetical protein
LYIYQSVAKNLAKINYIELNAEAELRLAGALLRIAKAHGITLCACCELPELYELGLQPVACVDATLLGTNAPRDKNQRKGCNCALSVDIGAYNSCMNGCRYCYANHNDAKVYQNYAEHHAETELLVH